MTVGPFGQTVRSDHPLDRGPKVADGVGADALRREPCLTAVGFCLIVLG